MSHWLPLNIFKAHWSEKSSSQRVLIYNDPINWALTRPLLLLLKNSSVINTYLPLSFSLSHSRSNNKQWHGFSLFKGGLDRNTNRCILECSDGHRGDWEGVDFHCRRSLQQFGGIHNMERFKSEWENNSPSIPLFSHKGTYRRSIS